MERIRTLYISIQTHTNIIIIILNNNNVGAENGRENIMARFYFTQGLVLGTLQHDRN